MSKARTILAAILLALACAGSAQAGAYTQIKAKLFRPSGSLCLSACQFVVQDNNTGQVFVSGVKSLFTDPGGAVYSYPNGNKVIAMGAFTYNASQGIDETHNYTGWERIACGGGGFQYSAAHNMPPIPSIWRNQAITWWMGSFVPALGCHPAAPVQAPQMFAG